MQDAQPKKDASDRCDYGGQGQSTTACKKCTYDREKDGAVAEGL